MRLTSNAVVENSLFNGHSAQAWAGTILVDGGARGVQVTNCTLVPNTSNWSIPEEAGGAIWKHGNSGLLVSNCNLHANLPNQITFQGGFLDVRYSNVEDGWPGEGNISDGVLYRDQLGPDGIKGTIDDDLSLRGPSPCADSRNNALAPAGLLTDLAGNPRFADSPDAPDLGAPGGVGRGVLVDMGCYEFQPSTACLGDINGDGRVDGADLGIILGAWGLCSE